MQSSDDNNPTRLTIGAVEEASGIPASTLRTWERRYGFPQPYRTVGGHRTYDANVVEHLQLIALALEKGHRPKQVVGASESALRDLLGLNETAPEQQQVIEEWINLAIALDARGLESAFRHAFATFGGLNFLAQYVAPFLRLLGERWAAGDLNVYQEHFASECLDAFLVRTWRQLAENNTGPFVVATTLPGERHDLGLHMAVMSLCLAGWQIVYLGPESPTNDILNAAQRSQAGAIILSISPYADLDVTRHHLRQITRVLPPNVNLLLGGSGAPGDVKGSTRITELHRLHAWGVANLNG